MIVLDSIKIFLKRVKSRLNVKAALFLVILSCLTALFIQYFQREKTITLLSVAGAVVVPFQEGVNEVGKFLFERESTRTSLNEASERIEELKRENDALRREIAELQSIRQENAAYRRLLNAKERLNSYEVSLASVIGNDGVNIFNRFTINLGSADGIEKDMNVITGEGGVVGLVSYVGLNYSIVTSIIEDGTHVSAMTKNGHENCIVTGDLKTSGASVLKLENALSDVNFESDGTLVTSYISDKYLPGLLIGYVTEVRDNPDGLTKTGLVKTAVDFTKIREVLVIRSGLEKKEETPNE